MKAGFMFSGLFWGILLIMVGVAIIIKVFFKIQIPIFRVFFAFFFFYLGISILVDGFGGKQRIDEDGESTFMFQEAEITDEELRKEYNVIFGKTVINLTNLDLRESSREVRINTIFGACEIYIQPDLPVIIYSESAFGQVKLPNGNNVSFGNAHYTSPSYRSDVNFLKIKTSTVFGSTEFIIRQ